MIRSDQTTTVIELGLHQVALEIANLLASGKTIAWIGSGLSKGAQYPDWSDTLTKLCSACGVDPPSEKTLTSDNLLDLAQSCKIANEQAYYATLGDLFGKYPSPTRNAFYLLLKMPFNAYVTTNFDPLLATAAAISLPQNEICSFPILPVPKLASDLKPIFYLHGIARVDNKPTGENLVLARSEFDAAYNQMGLKGFLEQLLLYYPIFFIGCSLSEPTIKEAFKTVHSIHAEMIRTRPKALPPARHILLPIRQRSSSSLALDGSSQRDIEEEQDEDFRFGELGITVLRYAPSDHRHSEIELVLELACEQIKTPATITLKGDLVI